MTDTSTHSETPAFSRAFLETYEIVRPLGSGAVGTVFLARQRNLGREVAVKVLRTTNEEEIARFIQEGQILARLDHPHVLMVFDAGKDGTIPYMVGEYVEGRSLEDRLADVHPTLGHVFVIVDRVADALAAAHEIGIVHRDVKPANILLARHDVVKLADFGMARSATAGKSLTRAGMILGTPDYMSPEQVTDGPLDHRTDQYSLAIVLYRLVTGRLPFEGPTPTEMAVRRLGAPPPGIRMLRPELPLALEAAVERAMAKDPADRFPDVTAFRNALTVVWSKMTEQSPDLLRARPPGTTSRDPDSLTRSLRVRNAPTARPATAEARKSPRPRRLGRGTIAALGAGCLALGVALGLLVHWRLSSRGKISTAVTDTAALVPTFGAHRAMAVRVAVPVPEGTAFEVRDGHRRLGSGTLDPVTRSVTFSDLPFDRTLEVVGVASGRGDEKLRCRVATPPFVPVLGFECLTTDSRLLLDYSTPSTEPLELVLTLTASREVVQRLRDLRGPHVRRTVDNLTPSTNFTVDLVGKGGWAPVRSYRVATLAPVQGTPLDAFLRAGEFTFAIGAKEFFRAVESEPDPRLGPFLAQVLSRYNADGVPFDAIRLAGVVRDPVLIKPLAERLVKSSNTLRQALSLKVLALMGDPRAATLAFPGPAADRDWPDAMNPWAFAIASQCSTEAYRHLVRLKESSPAWFDPSLPRLMIQCDLAGARSTFRDWIGKPAKQRPDLVMSAVTGLTILQDPSIVVSIARQLDPGLPVDVRSHAALELARWPEKVSGSYLKSALARDSDNPGLSWAAARLGLGQAVPDLARLAQTGSSRLIRRDAILALGTLHARNHTKSLIDLLDSKDAAIRRAAAWALGRIGDRAAVPALVRLVRTDRDEWGLAASALGEICAKGGDGEAERSLVEYLEHVRETPTAVAAMRQSLSAWALGRMAGARRRNTLVNIACSTSKLGRIVVVTAERAIEMLNDTRRAPPRVVLPWVFLERTGIRLRRGESAGITVAGGWDRNQSDKVLRPLAEHLASEHYRDAPYLGLCAGAMRVTVDDILQSQRHDDPILHARFLAQEDGELEITTTVPSIAGPLEESLDGWIGFLLMTIDS